MLRCVGVNYEHDKNNGRWNCEMHYIEYCTHVMKKKSRSSVRRMADHVKQGVRCSHSSRKRRRLTTLQTMSNEDSLIAQYICFSCALGVCGWKTPTLSCSETFRYPPPIRADGSLACFESVWRSDTLYKSGV